MRQGLAALVALAVLLPSCGHRGDPLPPLRRTPPALSEFRLAQRGEALEVRATAPTASVDGVAYEVLTVEFLHAEGSQDLERGGGRRAVPARPGSRVVETLPLPRPGTIVRAAARGVAGKEKGPRTLIQALSTQAPVEAPRELAARLAEGGVALSWRGSRPKAVAPPALGPGPGPATGLPAPKPVALPPVAPAEGTPPAVASAGSEATVPPEAVATGPRRSGFLVYRRLGPEAYADPLVGEPMEQRSHQDGGAPPGATACYVVRAVASTDPLIESAPSNEACIEIRDVTAPATPAGLVVLPREGGLEVLWSPGAEPDLAGYRIYRRTAGGAPERVAEIATNRAAWLDETARPGVVYAYAVAAFDHAGNESEPGEAVEASLP